VSFNNTGKVLEALTDGAALVDRSHWGRLRLTGADRLSFLHNQSTNAFNGAAPGSGRDTVLVTSTARCLDLATALVFETSVMLVVSPSMRETLLKRFDKYIFPADDVAVSDVTPRTRMFTIAGPKAGEILKELGGDAVTVADPGTPYAAHQLLGFAKGRAPVVVAATSGLALPGFTLIADETAAGDLYAALINRGCVPCGEEDWERARVTQGRPAAGAELTEVRLVCVRRRGLRSRGDRGQRHLHTHTHTQSHRPPFFSPYVSTNNTTCALLGPL
jgi:glycine cleavage system aminomethyltransferase T